MVTVSQRWTIDFDGRDNGPKRNYPHDKDHQQQPNCDFD
jgi:hypothetical protein